MLFPRNARVSLSVGTLTTIITKSFNSVYSRQLLTLSTQSVYLSCIIFFYSQLINTNAPSYWGLWSTARVSSIGRIPVTEMFDTHHGQLQTTFGKLQTYPTVRSGQLGQLLINFYYCILLINYDLT